MGTNDERMRDDDGFHAYVPFVLTVEDSVVAFLGVTNETWNRRGRLRLRRFFIYLGTHMRGWLYMSKHLITSALPYVNGVKHLGNLVGSLLPADAYARFLRLEEEEVLFICATDEHGTPAELSALEAGLPVQEYCDTMHQKQRAIYAKFGLSFDHFGRTSSDQNRELTSISTSV